MAPRDASGQFTIQTRVYLTTEQREKLFTLTREHDIDLPELLSELLGSFLEHLPDYAAEAEADDTDADELTREIQQRRAELRRLRARATTGGEAMPRWVRRYIADLERELEKLELRRG
jgi:ribosomal protein L29